MKTKIATSIEQSKKLLELGLDAESADCVYLVGGKGPYISQSWKEKYRTGLFDLQYIPCWSLAALIEEIPEIINFDDDKNDYALEILKESDLYYLSYGNPLDGDKLNIEPQENFVDACVAMIEKLHKLNLL